ncbi:MAG: PepSY domain-containing protein [Prevotella sp.]|nr:PepSY domain-containing protein [Prevotella sp.]
MTILKRIWERIKWSQRTLRWQHKWLGIVLCLVLLCFCLSGIVLNHRRTFADVNIPRNWLPEEFQFHHWNNGLLRGTLPYEDGSVLIYGKGGIFRTDMSGKHVADFNEGLPDGADCRSIMRVVYSKDGTLFAAAQYGLYQRKNAQVTWQEISFDHPDDELRIMDMSLRGDSLIVTSRNAVYLMLPPYKEARQIIMKSALGQEPELSLFRIIWRLHSGEMFGLVGRLVVDAIALVLLFLCVTGIFVWLCPQIRFHHIWHDKIGRLTIILTLFIALTGWMLRPPMLLLIAGKDVTLSFQQSNPWEDKLRALRFDNEQNDWLLYTSDGFYRMTDLGDSPIHIDGQPPVSVMGVNVLEQRGEAWLVGSFSGMYAWNRPFGQVYDMMMGVMIQPGVSLPPFGQVDVAGFSDDYGQPLLCTYSEGTDRLPQPESLSSLPMSLWNLALEVHTGRIFTFLGSIGSFLYIFVIGLLTVWLLATGWFIRKKHQKKQT